MAALRILYADDQIPPDDKSEAEFRDWVLKSYGDSEDNRAFVDQCVFVGHIVRDLRDSGYDLTVARTYRDAEKEISNSEFDLAIVDLGWYFDPDVPQQDKPAKAGWKLCDQLDDKTAGMLRKVPQIVFSSRFPKQPDLSLRAAQRQALPVYKECSENARNSLLAAISFVEASQRASGTQPEPFIRELEKILVTSFAEPLKDYRRWAWLTVGSVAVSVAILLTGAGLAYYRQVDLPILSSVASLVTSAISGLLYTEMRFARNAVETGRRELSEKLQAVQKRVAQAPSGTDVIV